MEKQAEERAAPEGTDSGGEGEGGEQPQAAGAQEDHLTLLLRLRAQTKQQLLEYKTMVDASALESCQHIATLCTTEEDTAWSCTIFTVIAGFEPLAAATVSENLLSMVVLVPSDNMSIVHETESHHPSF